MSVLLVVLLQLLNPRIEIGEGTVNVPLKIQGDELCNLVIAQRAGFSVHLFPIKFAQIGNPISQFKVGFVFVRNATVAVLFFELLQFFESFFEASSHDGKTRSPLLLLLLLSGSIVVIVNAKIGCSVVTVTTVVAVSMNSGIIIRICICIHGRLKRF